MNRRKRAGNKSIGCTAGWAAALVGLFALAAQGQTTLIPCEPDPEACDVCGPCAVTNGGGFAIELSGIDYDAVMNETTYTYQVCRLGSPHNLSHWVLGISSACGVPVYLDPSTEACGVKFPSDGGVPDCGTVDGQGCGGGGATFLLVIPGNRPNTVCVEATTKAGTITETACIEGPDCTGCDPPDCDDQNACTDDWCNTETGLCEHDPNYNVETECCDPATGNVIVIDDGNPCTEDVCNVETGEVTHTPECTVAGDCDDGDACTTDTCSALGCCEYEAVVCDDGDWCNGTETCDSELGCQPGTPVDCDDGNPCTIDSCDEDADKCVHDPECTVAGDCDDGDACTTDSCSALGCCEHEAVVCDDGDWCNGTETCDTELGCQAGTPVDCDDGNPCTVDSCDEDEDECVHEPDDDLCDDGDVCTIDVCDVEEGCLHTFDDTDADGDGIPDCLSCPPLDVVFVMDTSGTMADEAGVLCANIDDVIAKLGAAGVEFDATIWGISQTPGGDFDCLTDTVANVLGTAVPGNPPCCRGLAGREDWGSAVAIVAAEYPWTPGAVRVIVPLADEGPGAGDPCDDPGNDRDAITHAIDIAVANSVFVAPVTGTGSSACVVGLAADLAAGTGGITFASTDPAADLAGAIEDIAVQVCMAVGPGGEIGDGDGCPFNPDKSEPGVCGCGVPDVDRDGNGTIDCLEVAAPDIVAEEEIPLVGDAACGACGSAGAGFYSIATVAYGMLLFVRRRRR